jgi:hypothetical protein
MKRYVVLAVMLLITNCVADVTKTAEIGFSDFFDVSLKGSIVSAYSLKGGGVQAGLGYSVAKLFKSYNVNFLVLGSQAVSVAGLGVTTPLIRANGGILELLLPSLAKIEGGVTCSWGYRFHTDDNLNTFFNWYGFDYGILVLSRF